MSEVSVLNAKLGFADQIVGWPRLVVLLVLALIAAVAPVTRASFAPTMNSQANHVQIAATTDFTQLHAGESGLLAINLTMDKDWHTYWPGVSDTGYGISFKFETPDSITLGEPIWPTPNRYLQPGNILDHTYEGTVTVLFPFMISEDASANDVIVIGIDADYLVCKDHCLPEKGSTSTSIIVIDSSAKSIRSDDADRINTIYNTKPKRFNASASDVRLQWIASAVAIMFRDATKIEFYPDQACTEIADLINDGISATNRMEIRFTQSTDNVLSGRLRVFSPSGHVDYDIHEQPTKSDKSHTD